MKTTEGAIRESKIKLANLESALRKIRREIEPFAIATLTELIEISMVQDIHRKMREAQFSEKIILATRLDRVWIEQGKAKFKIISDYVDPKTGFEVSDAREKGTKAHIIPANPLLVFTLGASAEPIFTQKDVDHPGTPRTDFIRDTVKEKTPEVRSEYKKREKAWKDKIINNSS